MQKGISIIIPVYNEKGNVAELLRRLRSSFLDFDLPYEIIFVDDGSEDGTVEDIKKHKRNLAVRIYEKKLKGEKRGKAESLLRGFEIAKYDTLCMIDADLQYPPEAIMPMYYKLDEADIVVARRNFGDESRMRIMLSKGFRIIFGNVLLGLDCDVQSGLKVFKRRILRFIRMNPSKWNFDFEFLFKAQKRNFLIGEYDIHFSRRLYGKSKINPIFSSIEIGRAALLLRLTSFAFALKFLDYPHISEERGVDWKNEEDFLFLPEIYSVKRHLLAENTQFLLFLFFAYYASFLLVNIFWNISFFVYTVFWISIAYLSLMLFKFYVIYRSIGQSSIIDYSAEETASIKDKDLPFYSVIIPLRQEAEVISQIKEAMLKIDYPSYKLEFLITLEQDDIETFRAIEEADFPDNFRIVFLPDVYPKTKPKALNVVFNEIRGEFFTIYDAEIVPDPDQLKKAYLLFRDFPEVSCVQTLLDHYNRDQNILTRWFNAEFSFHYDMFLPGLQSLGYPIPLSGHSTHFRKKIIKRIGAWDPYNVAEDCDLGIRLCRFGYKTALLRSYSQEEATSDLGSWMKQRSRWMKGFLQSTLVHLRYPLRLKREFGGWNPFFAFLLLVPGTVIINFLNLWFWVFFVLWIAFRPPFIRELFPGVILYISALCFLLGNFTFIYLNLAGLYQRKRFSLVKYSLLTSVYWVMLSIASAKALKQLLINPYYWEKTKHGNHLAKENKI